MADNKNKIVSDIFISEIRNKKLLGDDEILAIETKLYTGILTQEDWISNIAQSIDGDSTKELKL